MKNVSVVSNRNSKPGRWNGILHRLVMGYVIFVFPSIIVYVVFVWLVHLEGKRLLESVLPSAIVFFLLYILYLVRPLRFIRFWGGKRTEGHEPDEAK